MRLLKKHLGRVVGVQFYDHAQGCERAVFCEAWGKLLGFNRRAIHIRCWDCPRDKDIETTDFHILRKTIESLTFLA